METNVQVQDKHNRNECVMESEVHILCLKELNDFFFPILYASPY